ncbi:hypothetical protein GE09DRAFT_434441 [Coniochaeta sp. 2T2.1]|nr:hypothetical protein GE09DRAFT_434441 [Coniochaeta sp. 2T2.1]
MPPSPSSPASAGQGPAAACPPRGQAGDPEPAQIWQKLVLLLLSSNVTQSMPHSCICEAVLATTSAPTMAQSQKNPPARRGRSRSRLFAVTLGEVPSSGSPGCWVLAVARHICPPSTLSSSFPSPLDQLSFCVLPSHNCFSKSGCTVTATLDLHTTLSVKRAAIPT